jgi:integrase
MANIRTKVLSTGAKAYLVRWRDPSGREVTKQFARKVDATNFTKKIERDLAVGDYIDPAAGKLLLSDWWATWWRTMAPTLRATTVDRDERAFRSHVEPRFGSVPIGRIDHLDIAGWVTGLTVDRRLAPSSVTKYFLVLRKSLAAAVKARKLRFNAADGVALPEIEQTEMLFINPTQIADLASLIDPRYSSLITVLSWSGLRIGEAAGLQWGQVDMLRRHIDVVQTVVEVGGALIINPPKTKAGRRRVPLTQVACDALAASTAPEPRSRCLGIPSARWGAAAGQRVASTVLETRAHSTRCGWSADPRFASFGDQSVAR